MFPTVAGQRVRVNYETGVPYRGESGFVESVSSNGKEIHVKLSDGMIQKYNKIYLSVILEVPPEYNIALEEINKETIANLRGNYSISYFCSIAYKKCYENFGKVPFDNNDIKELAIKFVKQKNLELNREMIWD